MNESQSSNSHTPVNYCTIKVSGSNLGAGTYANPYPLTYSMKVTGSNPGTGRSSINPRHQSWPWPATITSWLTVTLNRIRKREDSRKYNQSESCFRKGRGLWWGVTGIRANQSAAFKRGGGCGRSEGGRESSGGEPVTLNLLRTRGQKRGLIKKDDTMTR